MTVIKNLVWDAWNVAHIARHAVVPDEVEEVCQSMPVVSRTYAGRTRVIGKTQQGRILTVILAPKAAGNYYTVTARPASRRERRLYVQRKEVKA